MQTRSKFKASGLLLSRPPYRFIDCEHCGLAFPSTEEVNSHIRYIHGTCKYTCFTCSVGYRSKDLLELHKPCHGAQQVLAVAQHKTTFQLTTTTKNDKRGKSPGGDGGGGRKLKCIKVEVKAEDTPPTGVETQLSSAQLTELTTKKNKRRKSRSSGGGLRRHRRKLKPTKTMVIKLKKAEDTLAVAKLKNSKTQRKAECSYKPTTVTLRSSSRSLSSSDHHNAEDQEADKYYYLPPPTIISSIIEQATSTTTDPNSTPPDSNGTKPTAAVDPKPTFEAPGADSTTSSQAQSSALVTAPKPLKKRPVPNIDQYISTPTLTFAPMATSTPIHAPAPNPASSETPIHNPSLPHVPTAPPPSPSRPSSQNLTEDDLDLLFTNTVDVNAANGFANDHQDMSTSTVATIKQEPTTDIRDLDALHLLDFSTFDPKPPTLNLTSTATYSYLCANCNHQSSSKNEIQTHCADIHDVPDAFLYSCCQCLLHFPTYPTLHVHLLKDHSVPNEQQLLECEFCTSTFSNKDQLITHHAMHLKNRFALKAEPFDGDSLTVDICTREQLEAIEEEEEEEVPQTKTDNQKREESSISSVAQA